MSLLTAGSELPRPDPASGRYRRKKHKALLFGFIISPTEDHGQNSGQKEYFISCDKQRLQIPLTQVILKDELGLKDLMEVAVFLSPKHTNLHNNKTQKRKGTVGFAKTQTRPGSNVFEENKSLSRLKAKPNTWEEVGRPILAVGLIGEITPSQNNQRYSLLLAE